MELSEKQKTLLQDLEEFVTYGQNELSKVGLNLKGTSLRKRLLFNMTGATQSYVESILKIMSPTESHPPIYANSGLVLFRSINENLMNINWIYACESQKNAAIFHIDSLQSTLKFYNKYKQLMIKYRKYSHWDLSFAGKQKADDWDNDIKLIKKRIKKEQKRYKLDEDSEIPPLEQRCIQHDDYWKDKNKLKLGTCLEKLYITYYPYFSGIAHLTALGLDTFRDKQTNHRMLDSNPKEIESLIPITYVIYFALLEFFLKKFGVYNKEEMKKFRKISKSFSFKPKS